MDSEIQEAKSTAPSIQNGVLVRQTLILPGAGGCPAARAAPARGGGEQALRVRTSFRSYLELTAGADGFNRSKWLQKRSKINQKLITNRCQIDGGIQDPQIPPQAAKKAFA